jgi:hypothetical protein
LLLILSNF